MDPHQYCQHKVQNSGSNFTTSFLFLSKEQQRAITAIYAFCREVDDIVDDCREPKVAKTKLDWWQTEIERMFNQQASHPVAQAIQSLMPQYAFKKIHFQEMIQGMLMDLQFQGYETFSDLKVYCYNVASTVGLLSIEIFGYQAPSTIEYAKKLGIALQLVNIIRDVREDALRGRIYIPEQELMQHGINPDTLLAGHTPENFTALMAQQAQRARQFYQEALQVLPDCDRPQQRCGLIMAEIYFTLLNEIEAAGFPVMQQRTKLNPLRKLWIAWKTARKETKLALQIAAQ